MKTTSVPARGRMLCPLLAAMLWLAGCAGLQPEDTLDAARDWSLRVDGQAPSWHEPVAPCARADGNRDALLSAPLDEQGALRLALACSPALQALLADAWQAQARAAQAGAPPNPFFIFERVSFSGDVDISRKLGIGLTELLTWPWRQDAAARELQALRLQLARQVLAHNAEVRAAWVRAVAAQQLLSYQRQVLDAAETGAELARRMQAAGNFSRLQRAREQDFVGSARAQLARAQTAASAERENLVRRLGLDEADAARLRLPEQLPPLPPQPLPADVVAQRAMDERLDLLLARAQLGAAQRTQGLETVRLFDIELAAVRDQAADGTRGPGTEVALALPLFDTGGNLRQEASARVRAAQARFEQVRREAGSLLRERYAAYRSAYDVALQQRDEVLPLKRTIGDEMLLRYNGMLASVFELLAEARAQSTAVIGAIEAQRDFWLADAALRAALAGAPGPALSRAGSIAAAAPAAAAGGH